MNPSKQLQTAHQIVNEESPKEGVIAISLFGSVAEGNERLDSDLDIEIVSDHAKAFSYETKLMNGVYVDQITLSKAFLMMRLDQYPYLNHGYLKRKILYDPTGFMKQVME